MSDLHQGLLSELAADVAAARVLTGAIAAGDQVHEIVKAEAMRQPTVRRAMAIGLHVATQLLLETIEFGVKSIDGGEDGEALTRAGFELFKTMVEDGGFPGAFERRH